MAPRTAQEWYAEGEKWLELSGSADSARQLEDELTTALDAFTEALAIDPQHVRAKQHRVWLLAKLGRHDAAIDGAIELAAHGQDDVALHRLIATELLAVGNAVQALAAADRALARAPADLDARVLRARALMVSERWTDAIDAWRTVTDDLVAEKDSRSLEWALELATAQEHADVLPAAAYDRLLERHGARLDGFNRRWLETLRRSEAARAATLAWFARKGDGVLLRGGSLWLSAGRPHEALVSYERAVALDPVSLAAWIGKAEAHAAVGQVEQAIAAFERALELDPTHLGAQARLKVVRGR